MAAAESKVSGNLTALTDDDMKALRAKPNTKVYPNRPQGTYHVATVEELDAIHHIVRPLYLRLRQENPDWSTRGVQDYLYENCDEYAYFHDNISISSCHILASDVYTEEAWQKLRSVIEGQTGGTMTSTDAMDVLIDRNQLNAIAMSKLDRDIQDNYGGSAQAYLDGRKAVP